MGIERALCLCSKGSQIEMVKFEIEDANFTPYMQDSIVSLLIFDTDFLSRCFYVVKMKFLTGERKTIADLCYDHYDSYKEAPRDHIVDIILNYVSRRPNQSKLLLKYLDKLLDTTPNRSYVINTFGNYVKEEMCKSTIDEAKILIDKGKIKEAEELIYSGFREAKLITGKTFLDLLNLEPYQFIDDSWLEPNIKTFIEPYDKIVGGWFRKEMIILFGEYSIGKTFMCTHIGKVAALQGKNILHVTLETTEEELRMRYASSLTSTKIKRRNEDEDSDFSPAKLKKKLDFLKSRGGKIWLYQAFDFSFNDLVSTFNEIEVVNKAVPDVLILDSPGNMNMSGKYKEMWQNEKILYKQILDFTKERNITTIVTDWAQREKGSGSKVTRGHNIGGSIAKVQIPDTGITLSQNESENKEGKLIWFQFRSRGAKKFVMVEIQQDLDRGQAVVESKLVEKESKIMEETRKLQMKLQKEQDMEKDKRRKKIEN